jgi:hypothetical protein
VVDQYFQRGKPQSRPCPDHPGQSLSKALIARVAPPQVYAASQ